MENLMAGKSHKILFSYQPCLGWAT